MGHTSRQGARLWGTLDYNAPIVNSKPHHPRLGKRFRFPAAREYQIGEVLQL